VDDSHFIDCFLLLSWLLLLLLLLLLSWLLVNLYLERVAVSSATLMPPTNGLLLLVYLYLERVAVSSATLMSPTSSIACLTAGRTILYLFARAQAKVFVNKIFLSPTLPTLEA